MLSPYVSDDLFCDREEETAKLETLLTNRSNVAVISPRRYGKTGLILRTLSRLRSAGFDTCYVDIYSSSSLEDFIKIFSESIVRELKSKSLVFSFLKQFSSIRPLLSFDPLSGAPQLSFTYVTDDDRRRTLSSLLEYLESRRKRVIVAIDEFQQVREYEGVNMEALLRSEIQNLHNVNFVFSGSRKHLMTDMFSDAKSPFYESARFIFLGELDHNIYGGFIRHLFSKGGTSITDEALEFILDWSMTHTFYTQTLCHAIFDSGSKSVGIEEAKRCASYLLEENEPRFLEIRNLLTKGQWRFLRAIAKEKEVHQPTSGAFLRKYGISSGSSALRILAFLLDKELVLEKSDAAGKSYRVYNVFLSRWLESN